MTPENKIAQILKDNITFSPQVEGYVIHGAIEKILEYARQEAMAFAEWAGREYFEYCIIDDHAWGCPTGHEITTDELYTLFETQNKSKI